MLSYCILFALSTLYVSAQLHGGPHANIFNRVFNLFDKNRDDLVTVEEYREVFPTADLNGDGNITKEEFVTAWESITGHGPQEAEENRHSALLLFEEVSSTTTMSVEDEKHLFAVFDTNHDGVISRDEFLTEWERIHPEHDNYTLQPHPEHPTHPTHPAV